MSDERQLTRMRRYQQAPFPDMVSRRYEAQGPMGRLFSVVKQYIALVIRSWCNTEEIDLNIGLTLYHYCPLQIHDGLAGNLDSIATVLAVKFTTAFRYLEGVQCRLL